MGDYAVTSLVLSPSAPLPPAPSTGAAFFALALAPSSCGLIVTLFVAFWVGFMVSQIVLDYVGPLHSTPFSTDLAIPILLYIMCISASRLKFLSQWGVCTTGCSCGHVLFANTSRPPQTREWL